MLHSLPQPAACSLQHKVVNIIDVTDIRHSQPEQHQWMMTRADWLGWSLERLHPDNNDKSYLANTSNSALTNACLAALFVTSTFKPKDSHCNQSARCLHLYWTFLMRTYTLLSAGRNLGPEWGRWSRHSEECPCSSRWRHQISLSTASCAASWKTEKWSISYHGSCWTPRMMRTRGAVYVLLSAILLWVGSIFFNDKISIVCFIWKAAVLWVQTFSFLYLGWCSKFSRCGESQTLHGRNETTRSDCEESEKLFWP